MHITKIASAPVASTSTMLAPWMALFALSTLPLFSLQLSIFATFQFVLVLSMAMDALAHITDDQNFDGTSRLIKLMSPVQFALMIWLSVTFGRELGGVSFLASYAASIGCLFSIVVIEAFASAAALLIAGRTGVSVATLISAKYAGLLGEVK